MAMKFEDLGDVNKVHSVLEFLLEPDKLDVHLLNLKSKAVQFPSGLDLIRAFLKEAHKENTRDVKRKVLLSLVLKVYTALRPNLDEIEKELNMKLQRQLFECLVSSDDSPRIHLLMRYRWILRGLLKKADLHLLFGPMPAKVPFSPEFLATQQKRTVEEALTFLRHWIKDPQKTIEESELLSAVAFDLGEYLLHVERNYEEAFQMLTIAKETLNLRQGPQQSSADRVDSDKINNDILRCKLFLQQLSLDEIQQSPSLWLKIEAAKRFSGTSDDIRNQLETLVISSLLVDNVRNELTWDYRYALENHPGFESIQQKIVCCNILWQTLRSENKDTFWMRRLNASNPEVVRFLFTAASATAKQHSQLAASLQVTLRTPQDLHARLQKLVRGICSTIGRAYCWDILLTSAREFAVLPKDEEHLRLLTKLERNEGDELLEKILSKSQSVSSSLLLTLNPHLQTQIEEIPLESLFPNLLLERSKKLIVEGERAKSQIIESSYRLLMPLCGIINDANSQELTNSQSNATRWTVLLDKIQRFEKENISNEQREREYNEIILFVANVDVLPTEEVMERLFAQLLNEQQYLVLRKCCAHLRLRFSSNNNPKSSLVLRLEHLLTFWSTLSELCRQLSFSGVTDEKNKETPIESQAPEGLLNLFVSCLKTPANLHTSQKTKLVEWNHSRSVLSLLKRNIVQIITFGVTAALDFLHQAVHKTTTHFYVVDRFNVLPDGKSLKYPHFTQSFQFDEKHLQYVLRECLLRLYYLEPPTMNIVENRDSTLKRIVNVMLSLGDVSLTQESHLLAIRYYLLVGALETKFWTEPFIPDSVYQNVKQLTQALIGYRAFTQALVLCQLHNNETDYATVFHIIQHHFNNLDPFYYDFLWDMAILELLVYIHSKLGEQKIVSQLVSIIGKPEMNESNPPEVRKRHLLTMKRVVLKQLFREFLNTLPETLPL